MLNCGVNTGPGGFPEVPMIEQDSIPGASNDTDALSSPCLVLRAGMPDPTIGSLTDSSRHTLLFPQELPSYGLVQDRCLL
jgi:hypothetical protein